VGGEQASRRLGFGAAGVATFDRQVVFTAISSAGSTDSAT